MHITAVEIAADLADVAIRPRGHDATGFTCRVLGTETFHRDWVGEDCPGGDCSGSGVSYWYSKDAEGTVCKSPHPIVLVQGLGQYAESWSLCSQTPDGTVLPIDFSGDPDYINDSLAASPSHCSGKKTKQATNQWCFGGIDFVGALLSIGFDVITIDLDKAMADYNAGAGNQILPYDRDCGATPCGVDWMRPGGDQTTPGTGTPITFPDYWNAAHHVKCPFEYAENDPAAREYARRGRPLENAWILSLVLEYLHDEHAATASREPILIGHSLGGNVANLVNVARSFALVAFDSETNAYELATTGGEYFGRDAYEKVYAVITLGAPHEGSRVADFSAEAVGPATGFDDFAVDRHEDEGWGWPDVDDAKDKVYDTLHEAALIGASHPANQVLRRAVWMEFAGWRDRIDARLAYVAAAFPSEFPTHYLFAGQHRASLKLSGFDPSCYRIPEREAVKFGGNVGEVIDFGAPPSTDIFFERSASDADDRLVRVHLSEYICSRKRNLRYYCAGNNQMAGGWRQISEQRGEVDKDLHEFEYDDIVDGWHNFDSHGFWRDNFWFAWRVKEPDNFDFNAQSKNDTLVKVYEALSTSAGDMSYGTGNIVRLDAADWWSEDMSCDGGPPSPFKMKRVNAFSQNHHGLRTPHFLFSRLCDPASPSTCASRSVASWLAEL
jgi:hypothetical protein